MVDTLRAAEIAAAAAAAAQQEQVPKTPSATMKSIVGLEKTVGELRWKLDAEARGVFLLFICFASLCALYILCVMNVVVSVLARSDLERAKMSIQSELEATDAKLLESSNHARCVRYALCCVLALSKMGFVCSSLERANKRLQSELSQLRADAKARFSAETKYLLLDCFFLFFLFCFQVTFTTICVSHPKLFCDQSRRSDQPARDGVG